jgi:hypothetical protein
VAGAQSIKSADRIGRLGVMYFRSLLAQAGVVHGEISSGEDHLAVDITLEFVAGGARVQIKTGTKSLNKDGSLTVPVKDWRRPRRHSGSSMRTHTPWSTPGRCGPG